MGAPVCLRDDPSAPQGLGVAAGPHWCPPLFGRRVASTTQSSQSEAPSCSPFGKKKKCKDKYLAKHSSSKCEPQTLQAFKHGAGAGLAAAQPSGSSHSKKGPQNPRSVSCWDTERACQLLV